MKIIYLFIFLISMTSTTQAQQRGRILYIFGKETSPETVKQQLALLEKKSAGIKERDLSIKVIGFQNPLAKQYKVNNKQFTVVLVGKDGGEKLRSPEILSTEKLFATIDAMPMRQQEMRKQTPPSEGN